MNAARRVVVALLVALVALLAAWHGVRHGATAAGLALVLAALPWLFLVRGLAAGDRRTHAVASVVTVPYLGYGLMELLANPGARAWAAATVFLSFALFVALIAYLRLSRPPLPAPSARTAP